MHCVTRPLFLLQTESRSEHGEHRYNPAERCANRGRQHPAPSGDPAGPGASAGSAAAPGSNAAAGSAAGPADPAAAGRAALGGAQEPERHFGHAQPGAVVPPHGQERPGVGPLRCPRRVERAAQLPGDVAGPLAGGTAGQRARSLAGGHLAGCNLGIAERPGRDDHHRRAGDDQSDAFSGSHHLHAVRQERCHFPRKFKGTLLPLTRSGNVGNQVLHPDKSLSLQLLECQLSYGFTSRWFFRLKQRVSVC